MRKAIIAIGIVACATVVFLAFLSYWYPTIANQGESSGMTVTFYAGDQATPQTAVQFHARNLLTWLTVSIHGGSPGTFFTWALYERPEGTSQWIFVEGTGSVNVVSPDSIGSNGYCSWSIGIAAANEYENPSTPSSIYGWVIGRYETKITVTNDGVSEDSNSARAKRYFYSRVSLLLFIITVFDADKNDQSSILRGQLPERM